MNDTVFSWELSIYTTFEIGRLCGRYYVAAGAQKIYFEALEGLKPQGGPGKSELVEGGVSPARSARHSVLESYLPNIWRFLDKCATSTGHTAIRAVRRSRVPMPYDGHGVS